MYRGTHFMWMPSSGISRGPGHPLSRAQASIWMPTFNVKNVLPHQTQSNTTQHTGLTDLLYQPQSPDPAAAEMQFVIER